MEDIYIEQEKLDIQSNILNCYENLVKNFKKNGDSYIYFYYFLKQLQYEFYTSLTKRKTDNSGDLKPFIITSYLETIEEEYFLFKTNPNKIPLELEINNENIQICFLDFISKYFNISEENFYRAERMLNKFIDYEIKTSVKQVVKLPKLKSKYTGYSFSKLRLLLKSTDEEITKLMASNEIHPSMSVKTIESLLRPKVPKKEKGPTLDYDYDHLPLYQLEDFENFKPTETNFYLHQTYVQYHEIKKENQILNNMLEQLVKQITTDLKSQKQILTETRKQAKLKIKDKKL